MPPSSNTVTPSVSCSFSATAKAVSAGPRTRHNPSEITSRLLAAGTNSPAWATSADILGTISPVSVVHPALSLRSRQGGEGASISPASYSNSRCSWVQQIIASPPEIACAATSISRKHRLVCTFEQGVPLTLDKASASICCDPSQSHKINCLAIFSSLALGLAGRPIGPFLALKLGMIPLLRKPVLRPQTVLTENESLRMIR